MTPPKATAGETLKDAKELRDRLNVQACIRPGFESKTYFLIRDWFESTKAGVSAIADDSAFMGRFYLEAKKLFDIPDEDWEDWTDACWEMLKTIAGKKSDAEFIADIDAAKRTITEGVKKLTKDGLDCESCGKPLTPSSYSGWYYCTNPDCPHYASSDPA